MYAYIIHIEKENMLYIGFLKVFMVLMKNSFENKKKESLEKFKALLPRN